MHSNGKGGRNAVIMFQRAVTMKTVDEDTRRYNTAEDCEGEDNFLGGDFYYHTIKLFLILFLFTLPI